MLEVLKRAATIVGDGVEHISLLAEKLGAPRSALYSWKQVPSAYCIPLYLAVEGQIELHEMRPDLYPNGWVTADEKARKRYSRSLAKMEARP